MPSVNNTNFADFLYLITCTINREIPDRNRISAMDLNSIYKMSKHHQLTSHIAYALETADVQDTNFIQARAKAIRKEILMDTEMNTICAEMEKTGIWYLPLKGAVLKRYYPSTGVREMSDRDILFDASKAEVLRSIMESLGYSTEAYDMSNHDIYHKPPVLNFEMHRSLFKPKFTELAAYYANIEKHLIGDGYAKQLSPEDFYIYILSHEYMHYTDTGTGLRSLLDIYIYLNAEKLNMAYVERELTKIGIIDFARQNLTLAINLFSGQSLTAADLEILAYILDSGSNGNFSNRVQNRLKKIGGSKIRYAFDRFSIPLTKKNPEYHRLSKAYPLFYKYKILLPLLPFYRLLRSIKKGRFIEEINALKNAHK